MMVEGGKVRTAVSDGVEKTSCLWSVRETIDVASHH